DPPRFFFQMSRPPPSPTLFPYTTLFRSRRRPAPHGTDQRTTQASLGAKAEAMVSMSRTRTYLMTTRENLMTTRKELIRAGGRFRSEEHTSELQSRGHLVCRLLLEKKNK